MYAVVKTGGRQYRVQEGRAIKIGNLPGEPGDKIELREVLLMGEGDDVTVGAPLIDGARVIGTIAEQGRESKIVVFRYKAKTRSRKKTGHRQRFTRLVIEDILAPGQEPKPKQAKAAPAEEETEAKPKRRGRRKAEEPAAEVEAEAPETADAEAPEAAAAEAPEPAEAAAPEAEEAPAEKPKRSRRKKED